MRRLGKFTTFFISAVMILGTAFSLNKGPTLANALGDETATLTFTQACGGTGTDDKSNTWTVTSDASESSYDGTKGIHYGTGSAAVSYLDISTSGISGTISQIVVNASGASSTKATLSVRVGTTDFTCNDVTSQALTSTATEYTFVGSSSGSVLVCISQTSTKKALYCKSIAVTYNTSPTTTFSVTYDANNADSGSAPTDETEYSPDDPVTVKGNTGDLAKDNYTFGGWNTKADGQGTTYAAGATFNITKNTTLYAKWDEVVVKNITSVVSKPSSVEQFSSISPDDVLLNVELSNGKTDQRHPDTVTVDTNTTGIKSATAIIDEVSTNFDVTVTAFVGSFYDFRFTSYGGSVDPTNWTNQYIERAVQYNDATVVFASASKQGSTSAISDQPVTKGSDVSFTAKDNRKITEISWTFTQWGTNKQTVTLNYSTDGGVTYYQTDPVIQTSTFYIPMSELPEGTNAVKLTFSSSSNQIGITSCRARFYTPKALTSISLNTDNVQKEFTVGDTFNYNNLVVTANYNDGDSHTVTPTSVSTPDMTTKGQKTVIVSYTDEYGTASETYIINVKDAEAEKRTVSFYSNGVVIGTQEVEDGFKVQKPEDPTRKGYEFGGWFTDNSTFSDEWDFDNDVVDGYDVNLYAKWTLITYTLVYDKNGATSGQVPANTYFDIENSLMVTVAAIPNIKRTYNNCSGWNGTSTGDGTHFDPDDKFDISESPFLDDDYTVTLYAEWTATSVVGVELSVDSEKTFVEGNTVIYDDFSIKRVYENGYKDNAPKGQTTIYVKTPGSTEFGLANNTPLKVGDNVIKAVFTISDTVPAQVFESEPITIPATKSIEKKYRLTDSIKIGDKILFVSKEGDKYFGMGSQKTNNRDAKEVVFTGDDIVVKNQTNINLREFSIESGVVGEDFTGTFAFKDVLDQGYLYAAGGTGNNHLKTESNLDNTGHGSFNVTYNNDDDCTWTILAAVTDSARNKLCFNYNAADFVSKFPLFSCYASTATYANVSIYKLINEFNITYDGNGNTDGDVPVDLLNPYEEGSTVTVLNQNDLEKEGYKFVGWNTSSDGTGTPYAVGQTFTISNDVTLYAQWSNVSDLKTITFNANGGFGALPADIQGSYGDEVTIPGAGALYKVGYNFVEWLGNDGNTYKSGDVITLEQDLTLTAQWTFAGQLGLNSVTASMNLGYTYTKTPAQIHEYKDYTGNGSDFKDGDKILIKSTVKVDNVDVVYVMNHDFNAVLFSSVEDCSNYEYTVVIQNDKLGLYDGEYYLKLDSSGKSGGTSVSKSSTFVSVSIATDDKNNCYVTSFSTRGLFYFANSGNPIFKHYALSNLNSSGYANSLQLAHKEADTPASYSNDTFRIQGAVEGIYEYVSAFNADKVEERQITEFGIKLTKVNGDIQYINFGDAEQQHYVKQIGELYYIILNFGNALTYENSDGVLSRMLDEISVCAYVKYDDVYYTSTNVSTHSIASLVEAYHNMGIEAVSELYDILVEKGILPLSTKENN